MKLLIMQLYQASYYFFLLVFQYSLHQPTMEGLLCIFFANVRDQVARPYKTAVKITTLHILILPFLYDMYKWTTTQNQLIKPFEKFHFCLIYVYKSYTLMV